MWQHSRLGAESSYREQRIFRSRGAPRSPYQERQTNVPCGILHIWMSVWTPQMCRGAKGLSPLRVFTQGEQKGEHERRDANRIHYHHDNSHKHVGLVSRNVTTQTQIWVQVLGIIHGHAVEKPKCVRWCSRIQKQEDKEPQRVPVRRRGIRQPGQGGVIILSFFLYLSLCSLLFLRKDFLCSLIVGFVVDCNCGGGRGTL